MGKQRLTFVNGKYFVGDENGIEVVKEVFIKLLEGEEFAGNTGFGSLMSKDTYLYNRLLKRELQDISLISEMIKRGLPEETYLQFLELKENQLRKEYHTSCELDFKGKIPSDVKFEFTK
jgi:hypothetical protein